ncbi:MAG: thioredoxin family protein [Gemmataceae bacterium]
MDRSFLFDASVIAASRQFVCVRLATYEDENENRFLKNLLRTGSGELENSVFAIFAPDGKEKLVRSARGPRQVFRDASDMAVKMKSMAAKYTARDSGPAPLPTVANVPLSLAVAAADNLPLAVVVAKSEDERKTLEAKLATLAWQPEFQGREIFAVAMKADDLKAITGAKYESGLLFVQPEPFGRTATILAQASANADWSEAIRKGLTSFTKTEKNQRTHVRDGRNAGVFYEPKTPVTDPMEIKARERTKKNP